MKYERLSKPQCLDGYYGEDRRIQADNLAESDRRIREDRALRRDSDQEPEFMTKMREQARRNMQWPCPYCRVTHYSLANIATNLCVLGDTEFRWCDNADCAKRCEESYDESVRLRSRKITYFLRGCSQSLPVSCFG